MKKVAKARSTQAPKGNTKISSFFNVKNKFSEDTHDITKNGISRSVSVYSDDEFAETSNHCNAKNKENVSCRKEKQNQPLKKRKMKEHGNTPPQKRNNGIIEGVLSNVFPSTSEYEAGTSNKVNPQIVFIKSPEKLLSTEALKEYRTPEKQLERFLNNIRTPTPKKLIFDENKVTPKKSIAKKLDKTPTKLVKEVSPNKFKKTPKKLFENPPNNIKDFKVQVIDDFIKITPSKCNIEKQSNDDVIFVTSSEKKQSSILKYISPKASDSSLKAQKGNECTPKKTIDHQYEMPSSKIKMKLDFTDCKPRTNDKNNIEMNDCDINNRKLEAEFNSTYNNIDFDDGWEEEIQGFPPEQYTLDLSSSQHCKIIAINPFATKSVLTLKSTKTNEVAVCNLEGFWVHAMLGIGDVIRVCAKKVKDKEEWLVDNEHGLLVYEPDILISTTSVVNSLWCKRRSILSERFRGFEPSNKHMLVGTLVHTLLQQVLKTKCTSTDRLEEIINGLLREHNMLRSLYECDTKLEIIRAELIKFIPSIQNFMDLYVNNANTNSSRISNKDDWKGEIRSIEDIEENIWSPELGLKGKVDVSVRTNSHTMPLELKTGRASVSMEHRGQVMMYVMMMTKLGYKSPSGLLLYLREGVLREIPTTEKEKRDLIILRNELTYFLTRKPKMVDEELTKTVKLLAPELPEPIYHPSCEKCPYNVICTSYAKYNGEDISSNKVLKNIQDKCFQHLTESHLNYFMKWVSLIALESDSKKGSKDIREIYTLTPTERENKGKCIINLKVISVAHEVNGASEHVFEKFNAANGQNFYANGIMESNYVVVSTDSRPAVATGFVTCITARSISVTLDRDLIKKYPDRNFHIDSYDSSSIQSHNLASLTLLLELSPRGEELRRIIIDRALPVFKQALPKLIATKGKHILRRLNIVQQRAVLKAVSAKDYFLIKGMPGTGKTTTIVALIQLLYELGKSVLITSHTHSAVDNVCVKLLSYGLKLLRLGSESRMHQKLKEYSEYVLTKDCSTPEEIEKVYNSARIIAATCLGSGHPILTKRTVDVCIVDESTQVMQCSTIRPLYAAKTFILIGDPDQLPAVVKNNEARELGMSESLFERLYTEESSTPLNLNYRMNSTITALANSFTYEGNLLIGNDSVASATLHLPNELAFRSEYRKSDWILKTLDNSLEKSVQFLDTGPVWNLQHDIPWRLQRSNFDEDNSQTENLTCINVYEAALAVKLVHALIKAGVVATEIGIIATFRGQVAQISALLHIDMVDVSTVDQFQGKDKSVIIYSCTKSRDGFVSKDTAKFELLEDKRRLTVAITRAKNKLIILGDLTTVMQYTTFQKIVPFIDKNVIKLDQTENFQWESILDVTV